MERSVPGPSLSLLHALSIQYRYIEPCFRKVIKDIWKNRMKDRMKMEEGGRVSRIPESLRSPWQHLSTGYTVYLTGR